MMAEVIGDGDMAPGHRAGGARSRLTRRGWPLLAARAVTGAFGGLAAAVVLAVIGDAFPEDRRGTATGVVMSAFSVASIAGVPMGLEIADLFTWHYPFVALGCLGAANLTLGYFV